MAKYSTLNSMEVTAQFEADRTANMRLHNEVKGKSEWLRVVYEGNAEFSYFRDKGSKSTSMSRTTALALFADELAARR